MPETKDQLIRNLCDSWMNAAQQPGGGLAIGNATEQYRLHRNGISFHELAYSEIKTACTGLSQVLLLKALNTIIDLDHQLFWAWVGEMLLSPRSTFFAHDELVLRKLFETCIRAGLAGISPPPKSREEWERQRDRSELIEFNTRELVLNGHLILAYLGFPLLEGLLKKVCSNYVDYTGTVVAPFVIPGTRGGSRKYKLKDKCSSLRDLMFLLYLHAADPDLCPRLDEMRGEACCFQP